MHRHRHYFDWSKHKKGKKSSGRSYKGATGDKYKEQGSYYCCFTILLQEHHNNITIYPASQFCCNNISLIPQEKISKGENKTKQLILTLWILFNLITEIEPAPSSTNTNPVSAHLNNKTVVQISKGAKARENFYIYLVLRETRNLKNKSPTEDLITSKRLMDSTCLSCKGVLKPPSSRVALVPANTCCIVIGAMLVHVRKP